jgi:hypothetical protein
VAQLVVGAARKEEIVIGDLTCPHPGGCRRAWLRRLLSATVRSVSLNAYSTVDVWHAHE